MPFDGTDAPPDWRRNRSPSDRPELPWSRRDRLVAAAIVAVLSVITLGECGLLARLWSGSHAG